MFQTLCTFIPRSNIAVKNVGSKEYLEIEEDYASEDLYADIQFMLTCTASETAHTHNHRSYCRQVL